MQCAHGRDRIDIQSAVTISHPAIGLYLPNDFFPFHAMAFLRIIMYSRVRLIWPDQEAMYTQLDWVWGLISLLFKSTLSFNKPWVHMQVTKVQTTNRVKKYRKPLREAARKGIFLVVRPLRGGGVKAGPARNTTFFAASLNGFRMTT